MVTAARLAKMKARLAMYEEMLESYAQGAVVYKHNGTEVQRPPLQELAGLIEYEESRIAYLEGGGGRMLIVRSRL